jgi:2-polyprenyl-3-methyl-5-hydroxy-6-metoxy-1,4-benzoquinol methylase
MTKYGRGELETKGIAPSLCWLACDGEGVVRFQTDFVYMGRATKAEYVWRKYGEILQGRVLDVGADQCQLKGYLDESVVYTGMDLSDEPGIIRVNLEREPIPAEDGAFDAVLCLDVLEHLENVHEVFAELCRVTSGWLILSLPNPFGAFFDYMVSLKHEAGGNLQHYGLPLERPSHWHKWFFAASQAKAFVAAFAEANGMEIVQLDSEGRDPSPLRLPRSLGDLAEMKNCLLERLLFRNGSYLKDLHVKTIWWVLRKRVDKV